MIITLRKRGNAEVSKNIKIYRLYMARITQNKQEWLIFLVVSSKKKKKNVRGQEKFIRLGSKESTQKKKDITVTIIMILIISNGNKKDDKINK